MICRKQLVTFALSALAAAAVVPRALGAVAADRSDVVSRWVARQMATTPIAVSPSSDAGFNWLDAGIGAAAGVAVCLALLFVAGRFLRPNRSATAH